MVKWLTHMKSLMAAPTLLVLHVSIIDCTTAQIEMASKLWGGKLQRYNSIYTAVCIWGYICQNSRWILSEYLSFSFLSPTLVYNFFFRNLKGIPSSWLDAGYIFLPSTLYLYLFWNCFVCFSGWKRVLIGWLMLQCVSHS